MISNRQLFLNHVAQTSHSPLALEIERAEGVFLYSPTGKRYFDLISGISVSNTGHRHPSVIHAIKEQLDRYLHTLVYGEFVLMPQVKLAKALADVLPPALSSTYFVNSGTEAVEGALKLAKRFTGRGEIIAFKKAYHGSTHGSLSVMGGDTLQKPFYPLLPDVKHLTFNRIEDLDEISGRTACVIAEPVQGEAGVIPATQEFMQQLRKKCSDTGALLILDEIQTGFGRTGKLFGFENYGIVPDIMTIAKGMGGGMPIGAFVSSGEIMSRLSNEPALGHMTTFGGHPVCCAAALANLEVIRNERLVEQVSAKAAFWKEKLASHPAVQEYRSSGLMIALDLGSFEKVQALIEFGIENGIITDWFLFNPNSVRLCPPLTISSAEIQEACGILLAGLERIAAL